jgi:hypothetical protein
MKLETVKIRSQINQSITARQCQIEKSFGIIKPINLQDVQISGVNHWFSLIQ